MPVNRLPITGPPQAYDTFRIRAPITSHYRPATCAEVNCPHWANGWATAVDTTSELGQDQADYIRHRSGRHYTESRPGPGLIRFEFPAGQTCFRSADHVVALERDPVFVRHHGVPHIRVAATRQFDRADQWVEEFADHQQRLATERE